MTNIKNRISEELIEEIIEIIKDRVVHDEEIWDEESGVGWIDNEVSFFNEYYDIEDNNEMDDIKTVEEFKEFLKTKDNEILIQLFEFINQGGTENEEHWKIINEKRNIQ